MNHILKTKVGHAIANLFSHRLASKGAGASGAFGGKTVVATNSSHINRLPKNTAPPERPSWRTAYKEGIAREITSRTLEATLSSSRLHKASEVEHPKVQMTKIWEFAPFTGEAGIDGAGQPPLPTWTFDTQTT